MDKLEENEKLISKLEKDLSAINSVWPIRWDKVASVQKEIIDAYKQRCRLLALEERD